MIRLNKSYYLAGRLLPRGKEIALPGDVEARLIAAGFATSLNKQEEQTQPVIEQPAETPVIDAPADELPKKKGRAK